MHRRREKNKKKFVFSMGFIHPVQDFVVDSTNKQVYIVIKNTIVVYRCINNEYKQVGKWVDNFLAEQAKKVNSKNKKIKTNSGESVAFTTSTTPVTKPQLDKKVPISESFSLNANIRKLKIFNKGKSLVACTDSNKGIVILDVNLSSNSNENCLSVRKRETFAKRPNAITLTNDENILLVADKFGDVYSIDVKNDEPYNEEVQGERKPLLGQVSMLTDILLKHNIHNGKDYVIVTDRDEHIEIVNYPKAYVIDNWLFGHKEFISSIISPNWRSEWLLSAGGDDCVFLWNWETGKLISTYNYAKDIKPHLIDSHLAEVRFQNEENSVIEYCVAKLASLSSLSYVAFYVEATKLLFILNVDPNESTLSLKQTLELPTNIISLSSDEEDHFVLSLDNHECGNKNFVKIIKFDDSIDSFVIDESFSAKLDNVITKTLHDDSNLLVDCIKGIHPLYTIINLKKHGEHYS